MAWIWNITYGIRWLNTSFPVDRDAQEDCGTFRRWRLWKKCATGHVPWGSVTWPYLILFFSESGCSVISQPSGPADMPSLPVPMPMPSSLRWTLSLCSFKRNKPFLPEAIFIRVFYHSTKEQPTLKGDIFFSGKFLLPRSSWTADYIFDSKKPIHCRRVCVVSVTFWGEHVSVRRQPLMIWMRPISVLEVWLIAH